MKVCVIGNSHITALRWACHNGLFSDPTFDFAFWGAPGRWFLDIRLEAGRLIALDSRFALHVSDGRYETIALKEFDALVFQGPSLNPNTLFRQLRKYQPELACYSSAVLREGIFEHLDKRPPNVLIRQVRNCFDGPILASPRPLVAERSAFYGSRKTNVGGYAVINEIVSEYFSLTGVSYVPQPAATVVHEQYTAMKFCAAINGEKRDDDFMHMNPLYGAEVLRAITDRLGK